MSEISFDGQPVPVRPGQTVAAALWQAGIRSWRTTRVDGAPRGLFCGIGACYDCLATIDGEPGQRACLTPARTGMVVSTGAPALSASRVPTGSSSPGASSSSDGSSPGGFSPGGPSLGGSLPGGSLLGGSSLGGPSLGSSSLGASADQGPSSEPAASTEPGPSFEPPGFSGRGSSFEPEARYDVVVVGAGPAGLAAAATAALAGVRVALLDAARQPGGQFWRRRGGTSSTSGLRDGSVFAGLTSIVEERVDYVPGASVWFAEPGFVLHTTAGRFTANRVVLATGAYDRVLPFPGWDLPGVLTPGGAQALLKGSGVVAGRTVVVAGAGPFLLPVAVGLAEAGATVVGVFEAGDPRRYAARLGALSAVAAKMGEATGYLAALARHRVPYRVRHAVIAAHANPRQSSGQLDPAGSSRSAPGWSAPGWSALGRSALGWSALGRSALGWSALGRSALGWSALGWDGTDRPDGGPRGGRLSSVDVARLDEHGQAVAGSARRLSCDALAVGYGFTANLELALALGCGTRLGADGGLVLEVGPHGETSVDGVYAAGEVTGVGGARLAVVEGQLAGAAAAQACDTTRTALSTRDTATLLRRQRRLRTFADTMHAAHRVPDGWLSWPRERTLVCRCEEVTHGSVLHAVAELGATDARSVKGLTRTGMGWCQGRQCGYAVAAITARATGREVTAEDLRVFAARPLAVPVRLGDLADPGDGCDRGETA